MKKKELIKNNEILYTHAIMTDLTYEKALMYAERGFAITRFDWGGFHCIVDEKYIVVLRNKRIIVNPSEVEDTNKNDWVVVKMSDTAKELISLYSGRNVKKDINNEEVVSNKLTDTKNIRITERVKSDKESELHRARNLQSAINGAYQTNFLNSLNKNALYDALCLEKFALDLGFIVNGQTTTDGRLVRVEVQPVGTKNATSENTLNERFDFGSNSIFELTDVELLNRVRGTKFNYGKFIFNPMLNEVGVIVGYYLNNKNQQRKNRYKVLRFIVDKKTGNEVVRTTDWDDKVGYIITGSANILKNKLNKYEIPEADKALLIRRIKRIEKVGKEEFIKNR